MCTGFTSLEAKGNEDTDGDAPSKPPLPCEGKQSHLLERVQQRG